MSFIIEKDWVTSAGLRAVVIMGDRGSRCGYVGVPADHPLHGVGYSDETANLAKISEDEPLGKRSVLVVISCAAEGRIKQSPEVAFDVHGGLTYAKGSPDYPAASDGLWWFGYDCSHCDDAPSPEYVDRMRAAYPDKPFMWGDRDGVHRTQEYCEDECESLARQIIEKTLKEPS